MQLAGARFDQALATMFPDFSRSKLRAWIDEGCVLLDGEVVRPRQAVLGGERVVLEASLEQQVDDAPEAIPLDVLHEDPHLLVVNKPPGMVVHPGAGNLQGTLVNALLHHHKSLADLPRAGLVHRLDKLTSGLLIVAKTLPAHTALAAAMEAREISRAYRAVVVGELTGGGTVDAPIGRHPTRRTRMAVHPTEGTAARHAVTHYRIAERLAGYTVLDVTLETGRTHQIRVHMTHLGHPLVGDPEYGGRLRLPPGASPHLVEVLRGFRRQALHAMRLQFMHPVTQETVAVASPVPEDLTGLIAALRAPREDGGR